MTNIAGSSSCPAPGAQPTIPVVSAIKLPNGQQYTFTYDPTYGLVSKITYPTGGYVRYVWGLNHQAQYGSWPVYISQPIPSTVGTDTEEYMFVLNGYCDYHYDTPAILNRYVSFNGSTEVEEQDFSYSTTWQATTAYYFSQKATTVITRDLVRSTASTTDYTYGGVLADSQPNVYPTPLIPVEQEVQTYGTTGSLLKQVIKSWANERLLTVDQTILPTATANQTLLSETDWNYCTSITNNVCTLSPLEQLQSKQDYDFGSSGVKGALLRNTVFTYQTFTPHIIDKPLTIKVQTGGGAVVTGVTYGYDGVGNMSSRGNWLNTAGTSFLTTTHTYDGYGNMLTMTDPKNNTTQYSYADSYSNGTPSGNTNAYLTKVTAPPTNGVAHVQTYSYQFQDGQLSGSTDENTQTTVYQYNDLLDRLTQVRSAVSTAQESWTTYQYPSPTQVTVAQDQNTKGDGVLHSSTVYDGLGRTLHQTDPTGAVVDTTYDGLGHVYTVSNPHFTSSSPSDGTTMYTYDALGRTTLQTNQDGSTQTWIYTGNTVVFRDETQRPWQRTSDALGRLMSVVEPTGATTIYSYDALGNLLKVNQQGVSGETPRLRNFAYDSLSRLLSATNPETGTVGYGYDANGNMTSKTDARGIATGYVYDALNRLTNKSSAGGNGVPGFNYTYGYDTVSPPELNGIGRLLYTTNGAGEAEQYFYDSMGRMISETTHLPSAPTTAETVSATYDLAGNTTSLTYPDGRQVSQSINGAGRVSSVNYSSWNGTAQTSSYLTVAASPNDYDAAGHLLGATFGNGVQVASDYDNRERLHDLSYAGQANATLWGRQYVWTPNSNLQSTTDFITKTQRAFTFDSLNRLTSAQDFLNTVTGDGTASAGAGTAECTSTSGAASSSGGSPQWTDPDDSNVLLNPSEPANGAGWGFSQVSVQLNNLVAPDGSMTAHTVTATQNADSYIFDTASSDTEFSGLPMTGSVWLKSLTGSSRSIELSINANNAQGVQTVASKAVQLTTNWQQYQLSGMTPSTLNAINLVIGGAGSFTSGAVGLWQPTLENTGVANSTITNYQAYSQRFQQWTLVTGSNTPGSGVVDNAAVAPDGTQTAATVTPPTSCSGTSTPCAPDFNMWLQVSNPATFSSAAVTGSIWMRVASGTTNVSLALVETGSAGETALGTQIVSLTTDWQRFQVSGTTQQTLSFLELQVGGSGTLKSGQSIQVWGAQLELASVAGPYVPTGSVPASAGTGITNILPYSQTFTNWAQHDASITGTVSAPDGSNTAAQITAASTVSTGEANVDGYISEDVQNPALYDGATITGSVFLRVPSGSGSISVSFGTYTAAGQFQYFMTQNFSLDTTWRRFTITGRVPNALQRLFLVVGGNVSFTNGQVVDIWGGQLELASAAGPYVATNGLPILAASEISNILPSSQQISGPGWAAAAGSEFLNQATAPDNTNSAAVFSAWTTSSDSAILDYVSNPSYYDGQTLTASVYLRVASGTQPLNLYLESVGDNGLAIAGQQLVTLSTSWQRFEVTGTVQNGLSQLAFQIGGGGSLNNGESIQIWGAEMNPGSSAAVSQGTSCTTTNPYSGGSGTLLPNGLNEAYAYDSFGNIQQNGSFNGSYTANNQLVNGLYDAAGNLLSNYLSPMAWDSESKLVSVGGATYLYNVDGDRIEKQGVGVTDTVYFGGRPVARLSSGQWTDLIYGPNGMLGEVAGTENADTAYRLLDNLGTEVGTVDSTLIMANPLDYAPFGRVISGSTNDPYLFTGKERDAESGLDFFGARYYASSMGRFMSPDWSSGPEAVPYAKLGNPQSLNLYQYVLNNPMRSFDADGHTTIDGVDLYGTPGLVDGKDSNETQSEQNQQVATEGAQQQSNADPNQPTVQGVAANCTNCSKSSAAMAAEKAALGSTRGAAKGGKVEEWGGWILSKDGKYTYTKPVTFGDPQHFFADNVSVPSGYTAAAGYHTHPDSTMAGDGFSWQDASWANNHGMNSYLGVSYNGNVRVLAPGGPIMWPGGPPGTVIGNIP
jgi:RHS repeat-associated protein